jgi:hypothetical protein
VGGSRLRSLQRGLEEIEVIIIRDRRSLVLDLTGFQAYDDPDECLGVMKGELLPKEQVTKYPASSGRDLVIVC